MVDVESPPPSAVPVAARYQAAWAEITGRLQARNFIGVQCLLIAVGACSAILGRAGLDGDSYWFEWLAGILVLTGWALTLWFVHNDYTIGLLSIYCASLEGHPHDDCETPGWHREDHGLMGQALSVRVYAIYALELSLLAACAPAAWFAALHLTAGHTTPGYCMLLSAAAGLSTLLFLEHASKRREDLRSWKFERRGDGSPRFRPPQ